MSGVKLQNVIKKYGDVQVIHGIDLEIADGEFCVFVGPSGCGKSTLLRMVAGLEEVGPGDAGEISRLIPNDKGSFVRRAIHWGKRSGRRAILRRRSDWSRTPIWQHGTGDTAKRDGGILPRLDRRNGIGRNLRGCHRRAHHWRGS